jgi:hypothetical protein
LEEYCSDEGVFEGSGESGAPFATVFPKILEVRVGVGGGRWWGAVGEGERRVAVEARGTISSDDLGLTVLPVWFKSSRYPA